MVISIAYQRPSPHRPGSSAGARAGARLGGGSRRGALTGQRQPSRAVSKNLGSGARALRKYVCDASPI
eukprot:6194361-Pleurochrysis_carterae.AAC.1